MKRKHDIFCWIKYKCTVLENEQYLFAFSSGKRLHVAVTLTWPLDLRLRTLVYPVYQYQYQVVPAHAAVTPGSSLLQSPDRLYKGFLAIETATALACKLYKLSNKDLIHASSYLGDEHLRNETPALLEELWQTVYEMPPFFPGEDSLVWVYAVASMASKKPSHHKFFIRRLTELLHRLGNHDVNRVLACISTNWMSAEQNIHGKYQ